jgi:hypothetical protein
MKYNVRKRFHQARDFSFHKSHALGAVVLPDSISFPSPVLTQDEEDCTAFAGVATRYNETNNTVLDPKAFWSKELVFAGITDPTYNGGFDIQVPAATAVVQGFPGLNPTAYFWITAGGGSDAFDNICNAIFVNQRPLILGMDFYQEYITPTGIISDNGVTLLGGHCIKVCGWKQINGQPYLILQNSWGTGYGDQGFFYLPRAIANRAVAQYGAVQWSDNNYIKVVQLGFLEALYQNVLALIATLNHKAAVYPPPPVSTLDKFVTAIGVAEGNGLQIGAKQNNWGDLRFTRYTASLGATGAQNGFAVFPSKAIGDAACAQLCKDVANNLLLGYPKPCDIQNFVKIYAQPETQAEWDNYVSILCAATNLKADSLMSSLL